MVQCAAEHYIKKEFEKKGFVVDTPSCEHEDETAYRPYDLEATPSRFAYLGEPYYYIEVKGHRGLVLSASLSENEYKMAESLPERYIVCVVARALSNNKLAICRPYKDWRKKTIIKKTRVILVP